MYRVIGVSQSTLFGEVHDTDTGGRLDRCMIRANRFSGVRNDIRLDFTANPFTTGLNNGVECLSFHYASSGTSADKEMIDDQQERYRETREGLARQILLLGFPAAHPCLDTRQSIIFDFGL